MSTLPNRYDLNQNVAIADAVFNPADNQTITGNWQFNSDFGVSSSTAVNVYAGGNAIFQSTGGDTSIVSSVGDVTLGSTVGRIKARCNDGAFDAQGKTVSLVALTSSVVSASNGTMTVSAPLGKTTVSGKNVDVVSANDMNITVTDGFLNINSPNNSINVQSDAGDVVIQTGAVRFNKASTGDPYFVVNSDQNDISVVSTYTVPTDYSLTTKKWVVDNANANRSYLQMQVPVSTEFAYSAFNTYVVTTATLASSKSSDFSAPVSGVVTYTGSIAKSFNMTISVRGYADVQDVRCAVTVFKNGVAVSSDCSVVNYSKNTISFAEGTGSFTSILSLAQNDTVSVASAYIYDPSPSTAPTKYKVEALRVCFDQIALV